MALKKPITIEGFPGSGLPERILPGDYIDPVTLGSGTPDNSTFLTGDSKWSKFIVDIFSPTPNQVNFTLGSNPNGIPQILKINGLDQLLGIDYTVVGNLVTWISNDFSLGSNDTLVVEYSS